MAADVERDGRADGRMRLTVLGGFLGSGKTTWLRHQLHHGPARRRLRRRQRGGGDAGRRRAAQPVGRACGAGRRLRLLRGARRLVALLRGSAIGASAAARRATASTASCSRPAGSPIPAPIVEAIRADPVLVHHIVVSEIVVAVDARLRPARSCAQEPLGRRQMETRRPADRHQDRRGRRRRAGAAARDAARDQSGRRDFRRGARAARPRFPIFAASTPRRLPRPIGEARRRADLRARLEIGDDDRLDGLQRLAERAAPCPRRRHTARQGRGADAGRAAAAAERAQDRAVAGDPAADRGRSDRARTTPSSSSAAAIAARISGGRSRYFAGRGLDRWRAPPARP